MALFRRLFYRKPPDRLLEISERVYGTSPFRLSLIILRNSGFFVCSIVEVSCGFGAMRLNLRQIEMFFFGVLAVMHYARCTFCCRIILIICAHMLFLCKY